MDDQRYPVSSAHDFATWEPVLGLLRVANADALAGRHAHISGHIGRNGWTLPSRRRRPAPGRALQIGFTQDELDAAAQVQSALAAAGIDDVLFTAEISPSGETALHLPEPSPAVERGAGPYPGALILVEGALPLPWHRLPDPTPGAVPAPSADPESLAQTLDERLPGAIGATETEIAAAEARLGVALPEEVKALYRVTRARWKDHGDEEAAIRQARAVGCELFELDDLYIADAASRECP